nr:hypothetical protein [uncultured Mediterranean phage uvMED]
MNKQEWKSVVKYLQQLSEKYPQSGLAGGTSDESVLLFIQNDKNKNER